MKSSRTIEFNKFKEAEALERKNLEEKLKNKGWERFKYGEFMGVFCCVAPRDYKVIITSHATREIEERANNFGIAIKEIVDKTIGCITEICKKGCHPMFKPVFEFEWEDVYLRPEHLNSIKKEFNSFKKNLYSFILSNLDLVDKGIECTDRVPFDWKVFFAIRGFWFDFWERKYLDGETFDHHWKNLEKEIEKKLPGWLNKMQFSYF